MKNLQLKSKVITKLLKLFNTGFGNSNQTHQPYFPNIKLLKFIDLIFKLSPDLISFVDINFKYVMCSKKFLELYNLTSLDEIIGKTHDEIFSKEQASQIKNHLAYIIKARHAKAYIQKIKLNGHNFIFERVTSPIILNKKILGFLTLSRDISESVYLNKSIKSTTSSLNALINNAPYIAFLLSKNGSFINGNEQARKLFEKGEDEIAPNKFIYLNTSSIIFLENTIKENSRLLRTGESLNVERQLSSITGENHWYKITKIPIKNNKGKYYAVVTFMKNIDIEKFAREQQETYIATLTHDLKTPALAQVRALELLLSGQFGEFNDEQKQMLEMTLDSCNYMYEMIYTILSGYKFENSSHTLNYTSFDIIPIIIESIHEIINSNYSNNISIDFKPKMENLIIQADKIEIKRVIINLISNAVNYAFPSTTVQINLDTDNDNLKFQVHNQSPYIEPSTLKRLFSKYVTHADKFNKIGIGLGLYLSKKIIDKHNGKIIAESYQTQQNTFGFEIPLLPEKALAYTNT